jgi:hypothetical protein
MTAYGLNESLPTCNKKRHNERGEACMLRPSCKHGRGPEQHPLPDCEASDAVLLPSTCLTHIQRVALQNVTVCLWDSCCPVLASKRTILFLSKFKRRLVWGGGSLCAANGIKPFPAELCEGRRRCHLEAIILSRLMSLFGLSHNRFGAVFQ